MDDEARAVAKKAAAARYRAANREKISAYEAAYRAKHRTKSAEYHAAHPGKAAAYLIAWRAARSPEQHAADKAKQVARARARRETPEGAAAVKASQAAHRQTDRYRETVKARRLANIDKIKSRAAAARAKPEAIARAAAYKAARKNTPEGVAKRLADQARRVERYAAIRQENLKFRMSSSVRACLNGNKKSTWTILVGYTAEQLRAHIERQFLPKMSWQNFPKWHIDHIVPISSFRFETADDPEFKAAWALSNLRPLWATENQRKHAKREFLI